MLAVDLLGSDIEFSHVRSELCGLRRHFGDVHWINNFEAQTISNIFSLQEIEQRAVVHLHLFNTGESLHVSHELVDSRSSYG